MSVTFYFALPGCEEINMSNSNAMSVLRALGYEADEWCGSIDGGDLSAFIERCDSILAAAQQFPGLDSGREATETVGVNGCVFIDCGQRAGYIAERVQQLRDLADEARMLGVCLNWA